MLNTLIYSLYDVSGRASCQSQQVQGMSNKFDPKTNPVEPTVYQIRLKGHLGREWTDWFEGLSITLEEDGDTLLTGPVVDQAALYGLLRKARDLGMSLLSINCVEPGLSPMPHSTPQYQPKKETLE